MLKEGLKWGSRMIINTGSRTDIPAFYSEWFARRLQEEFVLVRNPYNPGLITRYRLSPDVVDLIGFCTKNPAPMLPHLELLRPYGMYWFVTITPYGREIEPNVPKKQDVLESFRILSREIGAERIAWRYDPIFISETYPVERHIRAFSYMAEQLEGYTHTAVISFIDLYEKTKRNFPEVQEVTEEERLYLGKGMIEIAREHGMVLKPCGEGRELEPYGADCSGCMTQEVYETALNCRLKIPGHAPDRDSCACYLGGDIGAYNTCLHMCRYCYANYDEKAVMQNAGQHDPASPLLTGYVRPTDQIHEAKQVSWLDPQMKLDLTGRIL